MEYPKVRGKTEEEYREIFKNVYCNWKQPIFTFDCIRVKFFENNFEHAFYESANWELKDKSIFSFNRAEKILWIKATLEDDTSDLRVGFDDKKKKYNTSRRVAIVKSNYIVIIHLKDSKEAKFISAFEATSSNTISRILGSPKWEGLI